MQQFHAARGITADTITRSDLATAGALLGPGLFRTPWLQQAIASTVGDRYLVVLFLDGGNDGLNTIVPVSGGLRVDYEAARKALSTVVQNYAGTTAARLASQRLEAMASEKH